MVVLACAVLATPSTAYAQPQPAADPAAWLQSQLDEFAIPGAAYAVIDATAVSAGAIGSQPDGSPLRTDSRMLWGSVSKPVTATVAQRLADDGVIDLDAGIDTYLAAAGEFGATGAITVRQLLQHTSGLPFGATALDVDDPNRRAVDVAAQVLPGVELIDAPGAAYHYSSLGYLVVQAVLEQATGRPLAELVHDFLPSATGAAGLSGGSRMTGGVALGFDPPNDGAGLAYGYQGGDINALAEFARWQLDPANGAVVSETMSPGPRTGPTEQLGLGWRISDDGTVWHTGTVPGYFSAVFIEQAADLAVVVLLNTSGSLYEQSLYGVVRGFYDIVRGADPTPVSGSAMPALIVFAAAVGVLALGALSVRPVRSRSAGIVWAGLALVVIAVGWIALPLVLDVPARYLWLWMPDVAAVLVALPVALGLLAVRRLRNA
ncbi:serine hydrolase [Epidermidibacterium keratini]|uniref:Serine hydrolase n=1 Tax=Epidermidibacterium keratini TaxID=1891644 RepID=A0A7L4YLV6_9ACTN|nr:serine hydrolase domain-containing protein [Epidermidibacterium keratini]QHC00110.1 serine hydrolase [Epidermidibacterium keratini]